MAVEPPAQAPEPIAATAPGDDLLDRLGAVLVDGLSTNDRAALADRLRALANELAAPRRPAA